MIYKYIFGSLFFVAAVLATEFQTMEITQEKDQHIFVDGEFLYWSVAEQGLNFAITNVRSASSFLFNSNNIDGKIVGFEDSWNTGWRTTAGYHTPYDHWDLKILWTHFDTEAKKSVQAPPDTYLAILWGGFTLPTFNAADFARGKWQVTFNSFDLVLNRDFQASRRVTLSPYFGVKAGWVQQRFNILYHFLQIGSNASRPLVQNVSNRVYFKGVGPEGGASSEWELTKHWSIYGDIAAALLYGHFKVDYAASGGLITQSNYTNSYSLSRFMYEIALGFQWVTELANERCHLKIHLGWEQSEWFGMNKMLNDIDQPAQPIMEQLNEDLTLQGVVAGIRLDF